jgi:hypothetical protein
MYMRMPGKPTDEPLGDAAADAGDELALADAHQRLAERIVDGHGEPPSLALA